MVLVLITPRTHRSRLELISGKGHEEYVMPWTYYHSTVLESELPSMLPGTRSSLSLSLPHSGEERKSPTPPLIPVHDLFDCSELGDGMKRDIKI